uniref:Uncharacterized protein n=1 Tax=Anopheles minimus TaxID=112268 RepID=A0A182WPR2_9DIPT
MPVLPQCPVSPFCQRVRRLTSGRNQQKKTPTE